MKEVDQEYYGMRAEEEIKRANRANSVQARRSHSLLAGYYLDRLHSSDEGIVDMNVEPMSRLPQQNETSLSRDQDDAFDADRQSPDRAIRSRVLNINLFRNG